MSTRQAKMGEADNINISYEHYMVHDGQMFNVGANKATLTASSSFEVMIKTGAKDCHMLLAVGFGAAGDVGLYEGITYTSDTTTSYGTTITAYNMNRESTNVPVTTFWLVGSTPSWTASTCLDYEYFGAATNQNNPVGGSGRKGVEWELKPNEKYLLRLTNKGAATATVFFTANFYEKT